MTKRIDVVYNDVMKKKVKTNYFYMRMNEVQKDTLKRQAAAKSMDMTQYIWHLIINAQKEINNETKHK